MLTISIFAVLGILDYRIILALVVAICIVIRPRLLMKADYSLLLTFVLLFVFVGNISSVDSVREFMTGLMDDEPAIASAILSQLVSNVPATVMLQPFTSDWQSLLAGVSAGGFGSPIASMASVITVGICSRDGDGSGRFWKWFLGSNAVMLAAMLLTITSMHAFSA